MQVGLERQWTASGPRGGWRAGGDQRREVLPKRQPGGVVGVVDVGVKLDRQPAVVAGRLDRVRSTSARSRSPPVPGDEVVVDPRRGDVLEVVMADVRGELGDGPEGCPRLTQ